MIDSDLATLSQMLDAFSEYYQREPLSVAAVSIYFNGLRTYSIDDIQAAASAHTVDSGAGKFYPKVADLIKHLDGGEITTDLLVASARDPKTPLGCFARIKIGSWDLGHCDAFYLRDRANECLLMLPEWKERAARGEYTNHEISIMLKYNVSPTAPFSQGLSTPLQNPGLAGRVARIEASPKHKEQVEPPYVPVGDIEKAMAEAMKKIMGGDYE